MMSRRSFLQAVITFFLPRTQSTAADTTTPSSTASDTSVSPMTEDLKWTDLSRLLACIAAVESNDDDLAVGKRSELSKYQISREVWYQHNPDLNFVLACNGVRARETAFKHLVWLSDHLNNDSPFWLAHGWRFGLEATRNIMDIFYPDRPTSSYCSRIENLYNDPNFNGKARP